MKFIAASILAFLLPTGGMQAQGLQVGLGVRIGVPSHRVVVPRRTPRTRVRVRHHRPLPSVRVVRPAPRGHWVLQRQRHWVPAVYGHSRDPFGRRIRYVVRRGYYEIRQVRVWVPARRPYPRPHYRSLPRQEHRLQSQREHRPQPGRRTRVGVLYG